MEGQAGTCVPGSLPEGSPQGHPSLSGLLKVCSQALSTFPALSLPFESTWVPYTCMHFVTTFRQIILKVYPVSGMPPIPAVTLIYAQPCLTPILNLVPWVEVCFFATLCHVPGPKKHRSVEVTLGSQDWQICPWHRECSNRGSPQLRALHTALH